MQTPDSAISGNVGAEATFTSNGASLGDRLRTAQAVFFVSLALMANVAWISFLGWLLYRTILFLK
jgi:hypothetical protein